MLDLQCAETLADKCQAAKPLHTAKCFATATVVSNDYCFPPPPVSFNRDSTARDYSDQIYFYLVMDALKKTNGKKISAADLLGFNDDGRSLQNLKKKKGWADFCETHGIRF